MSHIYLISTRNITILILSSSLHVSVYLFEMLQYSNAFLKCRLELDFESQIF